VTGHERLAEDLVPIAAELVGTVRDYGPADVAAVLARVPDGRHDALAVVLAAMVDPDAHPSDLLAWTTAGPVRSRDGAPNPWERPRRAESREYERLLHAGVADEQAALLAGRAVA
jgi:hypothetical protein